MGANVNDVDKSNIERQNSGKRIRRRKRMNPVYVFVVIVLVLTVGITMCFTFLFNIEQIVISGESENYTSLQIVEASGIRAGDNMLRLDTKKAAQKILDELLYVETAEIKRDFPSTLKIYVSRCVPAYNIQHKEGVLLVSRKGKILSDNNFYSDTDNLPIIYGFEPSELVAGRPLASENSNKYDAFCQIIHRFDRDDNKNIASIDLNDEYNIVVYYRNGLEFRMGNWSDVEYKLDLAQSVMDDESVKGKKGYLTMIGTHQCGFRSTGEVEEPEPATDGSGDDAAAETTTAAPESPVQQPNNGYSNDNNYDFVDEDGDGIPDYYGDDFVDEDMDGIPDDYTYWG